MNKPFYIFLFMILFCGEAKTQTEYITNGSFEQIDSCYGNTSNVFFDMFAWSGCDGWSNPRAGSTDLWCQSPVTWTVVPPTIPAVGFQYPRTGNNMAGIFIGLETTNIYYGEYLQNELSDTLKKDYLYNIEFYASKGFFSCTISQLGVKFFDTKYQATIPYWFKNVIPDAMNNSNNYILDTLGWQKINLQYIAKGNEKFVVIGSFADSLNLIFVKETDLSPCDTANRRYPGVYFFIDDVSITEIGPATEIVIPNIFTPNGDKSNDIWKVDLSRYEALNCTIYDRWGKKIFETKKTIIAWDGKLPGGEECTDGNYFYIIETEEKTYKGFIQLIR